MKPVQSYWETGVRYPMKAIKSWINERQNKKPLLCPEKGFFFVVNRQSWIVNREWVVALMWVFSDWFPPLNCSSVPIYLPARGFGLSSRGFGIPGQCFHAEAQRAIGNWSPPVQARGTDFVCSSVQLFSCSSVLLLFFESGSRHVRDSFATCSQNTTILRTCLEAVSKHSRTRPGKELIMNGSFILYVK